MVQQLFFICFRSTAQFNLRIALHSLLTRPINPPPSPHPLSPQQRRDGAGWGTIRSIYLTFFLFTRIIIITEIPTHTPRQAFTLMNYIPSPLHIPIIRQKGAGARAATVLFTPSLGRNWRLNGVYFGTRGNDNVARYCSCCVSWGLIYFLYFLNF